MQSQRRSYSKSFKAQVVQECAQPGASIASVAQKHSLNANVTVRPTHLPDPDAKGDGVHLI
ncbi:transposase [Pseudomonas veronii]